MAFHYNKAIQKEVDETSKEAEHLIKKVFPQRIAAFKEMLALPIFTEDLSTFLVVKELEELKLSGRGTKDDRRKEEMSPVPVNPHVQSLISVLKPHYLQMNKDFSTVELWLNYLIPKMEDGNNFGVEVLSSVLDRLSTIRHNQEFIFVPLQMSNERAQAVKKVIKHPLVDDYKLLVQEIDENHLIRLRNSGEILYRSYMIGYDLLLKNIEKVTSPRSANNAESLY